MYIYIYTNIIYIHIYKYNIYIYAHIYIYIYMQTYFSSFISTHMLMILLSCWFNYFLLNSHGCEVTHDENVANETGTRMQRARSAKDFNPSACACCCFASDQAWRKPSRSTSLLNGIKLPIFGASMSLRARTWIASCMPKPACQPSGPLNFSALSCTAPALGGIAGWTKQLGSMSVRQTWHS